MPMTLMPVLPPSVDGSIPGRPVRRVEAGLVRFAGPHCLGHFVVDFEDEAFGITISVVFPFFLSSHDSKGLLNTICGIE